MGIDILMYERSNEVTSKEVLLIFRKSILYSICHTNLTIL
jgi:hypothetical protein